MKFTNLTQLTQYSLQTDNKILCHSFGRLLTLAIITQARSYLLTARDSAPELRRRYYREVLGGRLSAHPEKHCTEEERASYSHLLAIAYLAQGKLEKAAT